MVQFRDFEWHGLSLKMTLCLLFFLGCHDDSTFSDLSSTSSEARLSAQLQEKAELANSSKTGALFVDMTETSKIAFTYRNGQESGYSTFLEMLGGGIALFDYDGDGKLDVFIPGGGSFGSNQEILGSSPALYSNAGGWNFTNVTEASAVIHSPYYSHGANVGDFDNDGFPDVLVTGYGGLVLFQNQGDGTFVEIAMQAGLHDHLWSSSSAWGDINEDSHLDLFVVHYVDWSFVKHPVCGDPGKRDVCPPRSFDPLPDTLYLSNGDGTFRDASVDAGLRNDGKGVGVATADVDLDGDLDIYVCNDTDQNFLYVNNGTGRLEEKGLTSGTALNDTGNPDGSMGVDVGDFNGDGLPDLFVTNFATESFALYRNDRDCFFRHVSQGAGIKSVGLQFVGWGIVFADMDRDGDEDIFTLNGHAFRFPKNAPLRQMPLLFENLQSRRFANIAPQAGSQLAIPHLGRGVAVGDIDNDGDPDLALSCLNEPVIVLSNDAENNHHWLALKLIGTSSNRDAIGAVVWLEDTEDRKQMKQRKGGTSYASSHDPRVLFGIGNSTNARKIRIRWPSGIQQDIRPGEIDQTLTVVEPIQRKSTQPSFR